MQRAADACSFSQAPNKIEKLFEMCFFFVKREKEALAFPKKERDKAIRVEPRERFSFAPSALIKREDESTKPSEKRERETDRT